jgi:GNAT superfamily N-acetyltransferase
MLERIPYSDALPASFFKLATRPYSPLCFAPDEDAPLIEALFRQEAPQHHIVVYTDHRQLRLVGLFPLQGSEAYFGFWETTYNPDLNARAFALLAADAVHFRKDTIAGPLHFNTYQRYRLRLGAPPSWHQFDREPVNPGYYPNLLRQAGFTPSLTFQSQLLRAEALPRLYQEKSPALEKLGQIQFDFIPVTPASWELLAEEIYQLIHQVFSQNPAYKPVPRAQFELLYNPQYAARLCPHSSVIFREQGSGRLAAISLCQPNYRALKLPAGTAPEFAVHYQQLLQKTLLAKTVGVHPDFRRQGLMELLAAYAMQQFQNYYAEIIFCLMRSDNYSLRFTNGLSVETAHYALFERRVGV